MQHSHNETVAESYLESSFLQSYLESYLLESYLESYLLQSYLESYLLESYLGSCLWRVLWRFICWRVIWRVICWRVIWRVVCWRLIWRVVCWRIIWKVVCVWWFLLEVICLLMIFICLCAALCVLEGKMTLPRGGESQEGNNVRLWDRNSNSRESDTNKCGNAFRSNEETINDYNWNMSIHVIFSLCWVTVRYNL